MKLVLYSGGNAEQNSHIDDVLLGLSGKKPERIRMTFIPSSSWRLREQFAEFFDDFRRFGVKSTFCLPVDVRINKKDLDRALQSDIIYMGGGNTFYFLKYLRQVGLMSRLRTYAKEGGILGGLSAGAIMLTPSITMASIPRRTADPNDVKLKNWTALNLVKFEFHAHYGRRRWEDQEMLRYSKKVSHPIFACRDGNGVLVKGKSVSFLGPATAYFHGKLFKDLDGVFSSDSMKR